MKIFLTKVEKKNTHTVGAFSELGLISVLNDAITSRWLKVCQALSCTSLGQTQRKKELNV